MMLCDATNVGTVTYEQFMSLVWWQVVLRSPTKTQRWALTHRWQLIPITGITLPKKSITSKFAPENRGIPQKENVETPTKNTCSKGYVLAVKRRFRDSTWVCDSFVGTKSPGFQIRTVMVEGRTNGTKHVPQACFLMACESYVLKFGGQTSCKMNILNHEWFKFQVLGRSFLEHYPTALVRQLMLPSLDLNPKWQANLGLTSKQWP